MIFRRDPVGKTAYQDATNELGLVAEYRSWEIDKSNLAWGISDETYHFYHELAY